MADKPPQSIDKLMVNLKLKKPQGGLTREQALAAWPIRNPSLTWRVNDEGEVAVDLPRRKDWVGGILGFLFTVPESKPVILDEVGGFVWQLCDGDHDVNDIVTELSRTHKLNRREAELSLHQFLQMLGKRGMVAFALPKEVAEAAGLKGSMVLATPDQDEEDETTEEAER